MTTNEETWVTQPLDSVLCLSASGIDGQAPVWLVDILGLFLFTPSPWPVAVVASKAALPLGQALCEWLKKGDLLWFHSVSQ